MDFENKEWKVKKIRSIKKRATVSICFNTVAAFVFGILPFLVSGKYILLSLPFVALFVYLNCRNIKTLWTFSQFLMIYKMGALEERGQWESHIADVDRTMNNLYAKKHT